ncbi:membrane hypothetical protein [Nitrolancea hollandica Lb]|uniref:Uncharacterized protein n=2 Tax=Nitrolancea hollandica TaxID=1206749 RepID=I4EHV7_9BACT|nr:membrane hypothetical protein [Nitrolancea hollandica Lb]
MTDVDVFGGVSAVGFIVAVTAAMTQFGLSRRYAPAYAVLTGIVLLVTYTLAGGKTAIPDVAEAVVLGIWLGLTAVGSHSLVTHSGGRRPDAPVDMV